MDLTVLSLWLASGAVGLAATATALRARFTHHARAWARAERHVARSIEHAPTSETVRLSGRLRLAGPALTSPLSGRPCAGYHATVEAGDNRKRVLGSEARFSDFVLEDESGRVLVEMEAANVDVTMDLAWRSETLDAETRFDLEQFLTSVVNPERLDLSLRERLVYREGALCPGEQVTVVGVIALERPSLSEPYRTHAPVRRIRGQEGGQLLVSDRLHFS